MTAYSLKVCAVVDEPHWSEQLGRLNAPVFHSTEWARYAAADKPNVCPLYCSLLDSGGATRGAALVFEEAPQNPVLRRLTSKLYCDAHPAVEGCDDSLWSEFVDRLEAWARCKRAVELAIGSFGTPGHRAVFERLGYELTDRYEFVLPLDRTDDEMRSAMERRRRRTIAKAIDLGVTIAMLEADHVPDLRRLQGFTSERLKKKGAIVNFGAVRPVDEDPAAGLIRSGKADLVGAWYQERLVSISLYTKQNGLVYSTLAGHAPEAYDIHAYTLMLWTMMRKYRDEGHRQLNIGGVPVAASEETSVDYGLYCYKAGMGGTRELCTSASKVLSPARRKVVESVKRILNRR